MRRWILAYISFICLVSYSYAHEEKAVTYEFSGGRLGDNLLSYLHAKWISYRHQIPLLYKPFKYSDKLMLDTNEIRFDLSTKKFEQVVHLGRSETVALE